MRSWNPTHRGPPAGSVAAGALGRAVVRPAEVLGCPHGQSPGAFSCLTVIHVYVLLQRHMKSIWCFVQN